MARACVWHVFAAVCVDKGLQPYVWQEFVLRMYLVEPIVRIHVHIWYTRVASICGMALGVRQCFCMCDKGACQRSVWQGHQWHGFACVTNYV